MKPDSERMVVFERGIEPFSGLPVLWIGGLLPDVPFDPTARVLVHYDGILRTWLPLRRLDDATYVSSGSGFDFQVLTEPAVRQVRVELERGGSTEVLGEQALADVHRRMDPGAGPPSPPALAATMTGRLTHLARRVVRKVKAGDVLRPRKWKHWSGRLARKILPAWPMPAPETPPTPTQRDSIYDSHCANNDLSPRIRECYTAEAARFGYRPLISILMPVYNVEVRWLRAAIDSVRDQVYDNWELCLADDASTNLELQSYLRSIAGDRRIKIALRSENGHICRATNSAAELATGDFVAFMDNDDALAPDALFHYVRHLQKHSETDILYSDEDKVDSDDRRYDPQFKPDWSPELFLSYNYVNHFTCMRRSLFEQAGRLRPGFEGGQDYDLLLRATERTDRVHHVPRILYHWRSLPSSTAAVAAVKPVMFTSCERGLRDRLARWNSKSTPYTPEFAERLRLPISLLNFPDDGPSVAILRLTASSTTRVASDPPNYRNATLFDVHTLPGESRAATINRTAAARTEEFILIMDASLEQRDPRWLSRLMGYAQLPGVGCVGPRVLDPDGRIVHAGLVLGMHDETAPGWAFAGHRAGDISYYFQAEVARNVSALSSDCLLTRRTTFLENGGFDAEQFPESLFVADYCRRLSQQSLRSVCHGGVEMVRHGPPVERDHPGEVRQLHVRHGRDRDPHYNPNLSGRNSFQVVPACPHLPEMPAKARARVLFAAHNLSATEGAPRYLFDIAAGLRQRGKVEPIVFSPMPGPGRDWYHRVNIPVQVVDLPHSHQFLVPRWKPADYALTLRQLSAMLGKLRPNVVVCNTLGNFPMVEAAHQAGIPSVWIIHESYTDAQMRALHSPYALNRVQNAFSLANRSLIASHSTARLFAPYDHRHRIEVIHNGLEAEAIEEYIAQTSPAEAKRLLHEPPGRKRIIAVGTVCERKGQHTLVEAAAQLRRRGRTDFLATLVGVRETSLSYVNTIRALIERERLHEFVELIPETNDVRPHWRASDIFVCASHVEAFSRSMLEAEAFGLPIVSTQCCGADEQVVWGRNAFRMDFSDSRQLADHLERLLADDALRHRMGIASRAVYECHLTNDDMLDRYERLILNVWLHAAESQSERLRRAA